jgi:hypothetical protein
MRITRFARRFIYIIRKLICEAVKEFNEKEGYSFRTNFDKDEREFYEKTLNKLGVDYRIENHAIDMLSRPISGCYALWVRGTYSHKKFHELYSVYYRKKENERRKKLYGVEGSDKA